MRLSYHLVPIVCLAGGAVFFACSDTVKDDPVSDATGTTGGGGGAAGTGGAGGSGGRGRGGASNGGGGGEPVVSQKCLDACDKIATDCGFGDLCGQFGVDCAAPPLGDCELDCVLDPGFDCAEIIATFTGGGNRCTQACGTGGAGGGTGGSTPQQECATCSFGSCSGDSQACAFDTECGAWLSCVSSCADAACFTACNVTHADASDLYTPLYACQCTNCDTECGPLSDPCTQPEGNAGGAGGAGGSGGGIPGTGGNGGT